MTSKLSVSLMSFELVGQESWCNAPVLVRNQKTSLLSRVQLMESFQT